MRLPQTTWRLYRQSRILPAMNSAPLSLPNPLPWHDRPLVARTLAAFAAAGTPVRFVGGAVRDALLGMATKKMDLDLCTPATPAAVTTLLETAGIAAKPTGIAYGTVTAVHDGDHLEITTLRRDIDTDGRHATVSFGTSWEEDAARRDFTINALSCDPDGTLHDYFGGLADLQNGIVRFIGDPVARVREDYLRILRFFRFYARFGTGEADPEALGACAALKSHIAELSRERVWMELSKLLALDVPHKAARAMQLCGVLDALLPPIPGDLVTDKLEADIDRLEAYAEAESHHDFHAVPVLRLAALFPNAQEALQARLKLSGRESDWLDLTAETLAAQTPAELARIWYRHQEEIARARHWLPNLAFLYASVTDGVDADMIVTFAAGWVPPTFPLAGADLIALGVESGPRMGEILRQVENWWIDENFAPSREACLVRAADVVKGAAH